jgi:transcriptional regulator with XRE-family HTH domain
MLTAEQLQKLKRTNISVNAEATKQRVEEIFRHAKLKQKQAVRELAGISTQTVSNVYRTGGISAKMALALAQVLDVSPFYLTGEADEPGEFSEAEQRKLLLKHGYRALVAAIELAENEKQPRRAMQEELQPAMAAAPAAANAEVEIDPEAAELLAAPAISPDINAIGVADLLLLLSAIAVKAKAGIPSAKERLEKIKRLLLA